MSKVKLSLSLTNPPRRVPIEIAADASAKNLFEEASKATKIPIEKMKLIFRGRIISNKGGDDEVKVMEEFKLEEGSVIHCMGKPVETPIASAANASTNSNTATTAGSTVTPPAASASAAPAPASSATATASTPSSLSSALLKIKNSHPPTEYKTAINTLLKILSNVINNPMEEKYRKIKKTNAAFHKRIGRLNGANDAILAIGFVVQGEEYVLTPSPEAWPKLVEAKSVLDKAVVDHDNQQLQQQQQQGAFGSGTGTGSNMDMGFGGLGTGAPSMNMPGSGMPGMNFPNMPNMPPMPAGFDPSAILSNPQMLQSILQNPMTQQMLQNHPQFANNPMMQQQMRMLMDNPQMMEQMSRMMSDPNVRARMNAMMQGNNGMGMGGMGGMGGTGMGAGGGSGGMGNVGGASPTNMANQMEIMRQFANSMNNTNNNTTASNSNQQQQQGGANQNQSGNNGGNDSEMTEEEMIAAAIARSLREQ